MSDFKDSLFLLAQGIVPHHLLSRLTGLAGACQWPWFKNRLIRWFIDKYDVDMSEAEREDPHSYESFNDFFTRALKADARPLAADPHAVLCPADGAISQVGEIEDGRIFQAKGRYFSALELLGGDAELAEKFQQGNFATLYLSPRDYHRVHMPLAGKLTQSIYIPGRLFSVSPITTREIPNLFARNERLVCIFETAHGPMAVVMVGAMIVAAIETVWSGLVTPPQRIVTRQYPGQQVELARGAEMGRFKLGSTVVLLFGKNHMNWAGHLHAERSVRMGELLGTTLDSAFRDSTTADSF